MVKVIGKRIVGCPYLQKASVRYCKACAKRIMVPCRSEEEDFCETEEYAECPMYEAAARKERKEKR